MLSQHCLHHCDHLYRRRHNYYKCNIIGISIIFVSNLNACILACTFFTCFLLALVRLHEDPKIHFSYKSKWNKSMSMVKERIQKEQANCKRKRSRWESAAERMIMIIEMTVRKVYCEEDRKIICTHIKSQCRINSEKSWERSKQVNQHEHHHHLHSPPPK